VTATITLDPDPPSVGTVDVGYTGSLPRTLRARFRVDNVWSDWFDVVCTTANGGVANVGVPTGATRMQVEDPDGDAPVRDVPVA
jgi:hypothetical protein